MNHDWPSAIASGWHPLAHAHEIGARPLARELMGVPVVLFKGRTGVAALVDRCPHRNVPLSAGRICDHELVCPYHGWQFDDSGRCVKVPGSPQVPAASARRLHVREQAGLVWVSLVDTPGPMPELPPELSDASLDRFWWPLPPAHARLLDAIENLLDPAHPHFLHPYLVRSPSRRQPVKVTVTTHARGGEARYDEGDTPLAWLPRLFEGQRKTAVGRYFAPTLAQVAFESARGPSIAISVIFTPESADRTRPFAHFASRRGLLPAWFKRLALIAFHKPVLRQDQQALARQADTIARFGAADFHIGPLDLLGPLIWDLAHGRAHAPQRRELELWL